MSTIIKLLREIRIEKGVTIANLARDLDTSHSNISDWESGRHEPKISSLEKWADALGYEFDLHMKEPANV